MAEPLIYHRSPEFREIFARLTNNLQYVFQTSGPVLTLTSSGTGGMESTFVSLFSPGDTVVSVNGGKFGERWVRMPRQMGLVAVEISVEWGKPTDVEKVLEALRQHPEAKAVYLTQCETSSGTLTDIKTISSSIRSASKALVCVDAVSSLGADELHFDDWGIDACVTASQKGLMTPPGLAFVALSNRAVEAVERSRMPKFYFHLGEALRALQTYDTPWTPAISLVSGADAALHMIKTEGLHMVWERHSRIASGVRAAIQALGLKLFSERPSNALTAVWIPDGIQWADLNRSFREKSAITVAGGQGPYAGKIFRIAHLGHTSQEDALTVIKALERGLADSGWKYERKAGIRAVVENFHNREK
jgi:aspartate aminotransferase-like enzyme